MEAGVVALMGRYDAATNVLLDHLPDAADPSAATTEGYLSAFVPGSAFASGALAAWLREAAEGHSYRQGAGGQMVTTRVTSVEPVMAGAVGFAVCVASSFVVVDRGGQVLESQGGIAAGHGVAVLADGQWRLRDLSLTPSGNCSKSQAGS